MDNVWPFWAIVKLDHGETVPSQVDANIKGIKEVGNVSLSLTVIAVVPVLVYDTT